MERESDEVTSKEALSVLKKISTKCMKNDILNNIRIDSCLSIFFFLLETCSVMKFPNTISVNSLFSSLILQHIRYPAL